MGTSGRFSKSPLAASDFMPAVVRSCKAVGELKRKVGAGGTALGLGIAENLLQTGLCGDLRGSSTPVVGRCFEIILRRALPDAKCAGVVPPTAVNHTTVAPRGANGKNAC